MRVTNTLGAVTFMLAYGAVSTGSSPHAPLGLVPSAQEQLVRQGESASKTNSVYFPDIVAPSGAGIGFVRLVLTCAHVASITRIPDDWYVQTLRPNSQSSPEWAEFQLASNAVELAAGHGVTRLPKLGLLDGAIRIEVDDGRCFDMAADIRDDLCSDWKVRLRKAQLQLRN